MIGVPPGSDCVDANDAVFPGEFPYLAEANEADDDNADDDDDDDDDDEDDDDDDEDED